MEQFAEWNIYENNIAFFYENRHRVLTCPRYLFTPLPVRIYGIRSLYLGVLIKAWVDYPDIFHLPCCQNYCDGIALIYSFAGSPMTGSSWHSSVCLKCGNIHVGRNIRSFGAMIRPLGNLSHVYKNQMLDNGISLGEVIN